MSQQLHDLPAQIRACDLCADRFAATQTHHRPNPVPWFAKGARILIAGQAPGAQVHRIGRPFADRSGDRLRDWMGVDTATFYDQSRMAIVPMAFCFPGYDRNKSDLPPPKICAATWRTRVLRYIGPVDLTVLVGGYAVGWHLGARNVTDTVRAWRDYAPAIFPLPHPSWRNTAWLKKNPWFKDDLLPALRQRIKKVLADR